MFYEAAVLSTKNSWELLSLYSSHFAPSFFDNWAWNMSSIDFIGCENNWDSHLERALKAANHVALNHHTLIYPENSLFSRLNAVIVAWVYN